MSSFSIQAIKDTLQGIQGAISSKIIPAVGTFLGKSVTFISANPLTAVAVVAAVITVSLVVFAAYKHYQYHQQLKAENASLKNLLDTSTTDNTTFKHLLDTATTDLNQENIKTTTLNKKLKKALETGNFAVQCQNSEIDNLSKENASLKAEIKQLKEDRALDQEAAEELVAEQLTKIANLEKQILNK